VARSFVAGFLVPLVRGGRLHVGRPLGARAVERLGRLAAAREAAGPRDDDAVAALAVARAEVASRFLPDAAAPPLDETTLRLGAAVHDLLVLIHPDLEGPRIARRRERIAEAARGLASVGAPRSAEEAVARHSLLARVPEIGRTDSTVSFWLGRQTFVGRPPPARVTALPALRRVRVDVVKRSWWRDIGVPAVAREALLALGAASPLGEALDPLRLDPSFSFARVLPVLRAPALCRVVAGRMLDVGLDRAGDALAMSLLRFASRQESGGQSGGVEPTPEAVAFALRFLAHVVWLDVLFAGGAATPEPGAPRGDVAPGTGTELGTLLTTAARFAPALVWPPDVAADSDAGRAFAARLDELGRRARGSTSVEAARGVVEYAARGVVTLVADAGGAARPIHI
jgi:hypothetical protein